MASVPSYLDKFIESGVSSAQASISVLLVLLYGFLLRKKQFITKEGESNVSKLGTTILLPALLFSEIGALSTMDNLRKYWIIIPLSLLFQGIAFAVGFLSSRIGGLPQHFVPAFVFNNVTSLPLLLVSALAATGSLDDLVLPGQTLSEVLQRARVYVLINALVGNLARFAFGPYLMQTPAPPGFAYLDAAVAPVPILEAEAGHGRISLPPDHSELVKGTLRRRAEAVGAYFNPPLLGGIAAVVFGIIPFLHRQFFEKSGWMVPFSDSLSSVGKLYPSLQMLVLGANLYSKKGSRVSPFHLLWLFTYRFLLAPAISISTIWFLRLSWPGLIADDPVLDFILMISNVGPPALTLSAVAQMANLPPQIDGEISRIIIVSYAVTPSIALAVTAALAVVTEMRIHE